MLNFKLVFSYAFRDLARQKVRTILGVIGVTISVGLLAIVLFISDSISVSFVDYLALDAGNQDMVVTVRHYNGEPENRSSFFEFNPVIDTIKDKTDDIENFIPRMEANGLVNISEGFDTEDTTKLQEDCLISGIDFSLEEKINFGYFIKPDTNDPMKLDSLKVNSCAIYYGFNDLIKYSEGDNILIEMVIAHGDKTIKKTVELKIDAIFDYNLKWQADYRQSNLIVVDIETLYHIFGYTEFKDKCSKLIMTFANADTIYDARDVEGSERIVKSIAEDVQLALGVDGWNVELPKLRILGYSEFITMGITVMFVFVSIIALLIAGILINGILKTSVEERIREFGVFRTLGAHRGFNLAVVLVQGFLLCNFGTLAGIFGAFFGTEYVLIPAAEEYLLGDVMGGQLTLQFSFTIMSFLIAYLMGISVGLIVSISPALKVLRLQLIEAIHPYRHEDTLYHLQKRASINYKLIIVGIILAVNGGFIYFVIPRLLISMNMALMAGTLIAVLLIFLIGLTLAGLGLMPIVLRLTIEIFRPGAKRLMHVIKIFVFRYQRRNSSTIIIFALSFSFVMFTSTIIETQSAQVSVLIKLRFGSDLSMETVGWKDISEWYEDRGMFGGGMGGGMGGGAGDGGGFFGTSTRTPNYYSIKDDDNIQLQEETNEFGIDPNRILTTDFKEKLLAIDGIEKVSTVLASPDQLTQIYSSANKRFTAELGDYAGLSSNSITLIGLDDAYPSTINTEYMVFSRGTSEDAFKQILNTTGDYRCIISEAIAVEMNLELGDRIRITIERGDEMENYPFIIVGMATAMPGFAQEFGGSRYRSDEGGVIVSQQTYLDIMDLPSPAWVDKIFIKLRDNTLSVANNIENEIDDLYQNDYDYDLYNLDQMLDRQQEAFSIMNIFFTIILMATVIICLFGLLSSSYSTILERKKEIGIVRTLGLKGREIEKMFIFEALIIMLASGTVGTLVGFSTGWLLASNLNLFTDIPYNPTFPWINFFVIYGVSIAFILFGMRIMLRKARKQKIVEIYRETS
ncbi:MAG: ABC transporter permease [Promethearchaeota archaeon]